jgi:hypothetical protein
MIFRISHNYHGKLHCSSAYFTISVYYCENELRDIKQVRQTHEETELSHEKIALSV